MDHNYNLKIGDFGWVGPAQGRPENNNWLQTYCGTLLYMAPEILLNEPYDGKLVDIFAAGIIMFIMATGCHPFNGTATPDTKLYKSIAGKRADVFWKYKRKEMKEDVINNQSFCQLFESMVSLDPTERPSIDNILKHPWMQGQIYTNA
jgi:serine/threonine protein kinase